MGNRVVRAAILESDSVNKLTWGGEVFYRRLMSILDDFGRCDGRVSILRSKLYPLRLDKVSESDVSKWLSECENAALVRIYLVENKPYLELFNFNQTVRIKKSFFPAPIDPYVQLLADASKRVSETETILETVLETETPPLRAFEVPFVDDVLKAWVEWEVYKKEKKQKLSPSTAKKQILFLQGRAGPEIIGIINQSITNGWTGLFELKNNSNGTIKRTSGQNSTDPGRGKDYAAEGF